MFMCSAGMPDFLAVCSTTLACRGTVSGPLDRLDCGRTFVGCSRCCIAIQGTIVSLEGCRLLALT